MNAIQALIDDFNRQAQLARMSSQLTLGKLLDRLRELPENLEIHAFRNPHSYRGYYCDLSFESDEGTVRCDDLRSLCQGCMGEVYTGYKGGKYQMGKMTPVWIASEGCCGRKLLDITDKGLLVLGDDE